MKAKDLINELSKLDPDTDIVLFGKEMCEYESIFHLDKVALNKNLNNGCLGDEPFKGFPIKAYVLNYKIRYK